jgi:protein SCO1/2
MSSSPAGAAPLRRPLRLPVNMRLIGALASIAILLLAVGYAVMELRLLGSAAPDFTLTDQDGKPWTLSQERGHDAVALFFGYTHCPDVCPTTLAHLAQAKRLMPGGGENLQVTFVTVDAPRDTPGVLKRYVTLFNSGVVGLTGDSRTIDPVYAAYHVWHQALPHSDSAGGYLVSHTSGIYLIDKAGQMRGIADWAEPASSLATKLKKLVS